MRSIFYSSALYILLWQSLSSAGLVVSDDLTWCMSRSLFSIGKRDFVYLAIITLMLE